MSQKQRIFNLLAKKPATKLSATRKVKFALVDDLLELTKQATRVNSEALANYNRYEELQERYSEELRAKEMLLDETKEIAEALLDEIKSKFRQVESAANDIGVTLPNQVEIAYADAVDDLEWVMNPKGF